MFSSVKTPQGWRRAEPRPSPEELGEWYANKYYQTADQRKTTYQMSYNDEELRHKRLLAAQIIHAVSPPDAGERSGTLLDVGCGEGFVLQAASEAGWRVEGIDFNNEAVRHFNPDVADRVQAGDAYTIMDGLVGKGVRYGACVLTNVLEHVLEPEQLLRTLRNLMEPGGRLCVTVPNDYSRLQLALMERGELTEEYWFCPPSHLNYFNTETLLPLCREMGYEIADLFAGFPVEMFHVHPGSRYAGDRVKGRQAHESRVFLDLLMAEYGMDAYHQLSRGWAACGMGRVISVVLV